MSLIGSTLNMALRGTMSRSPSYILLLLLLLLLLLILLLLLLLIAGVKRKRRKADRTSDADPSADRASSSDAEHGIKKQIQWNYEAKMAAMKEVIAIDPYSKQHNGINSFFACVLYYLFCLLLFDSVQRWARHGLKLCRDCIRVIQANFEV